MTTKDAIKHLSWKISFAKQCDEKWAGGVHIDALEIAVRAMAEERKKGEWMPQDYNKTNGIVSTAVYYYPKCSVCGQCANYTNFCPNCGADMREGRTDVGSKM